MANIIEIHMLVPYGANALNRDGEGRVKTGTFGGKSVVRISSQSKKASVRDAFGETYRTRQPVTPLMEMYIANNPSANEDEIKYMQTIFAGITASVAEKGGTYATKEMAQYSHSEIEAIYNFAINLTEKEQKCFASAKEKDKGKDALINDLKIQLMQAGLSDEIAVFGRMTTTALGDTVPSSVHMNHMLGIDTATQEYDYFTAFDNVIQQSGMLGAASFAGSIMYGYANIDPTQVYRNLVAQIESMNFNEEELKDLRMEYSERAIDATIKFIKTYITSHPNGKQNSMATYPLPNAIYISYGENIFPCTAESAFVKPIFSGYKSVIEQGAQRLYNYITEDAFPQDYKMQTILRDSNLKESGCFEKFKDVRSTRELDSTLSELREYLRESFKNYLG